MEIVERTADGTRTKHLITVEGKDRTICVAWSPAGQVRMVDNGEAGQMSSALDAVLITRILGVLGIEPPVKKKEYRYLESEETIEPDDLCTYNGWFVVDDSHVGKTPDPAFTYQREVK